MLISEEIEEIFRMVVKKQNNLSNRVKSRFYSIFFPISVVFFVFLSAQAILFSSVFTNVGIDIIANNYSTSLSMISKYYQQLRFNSVPIASSLLDDDKVQNYIFSREDETQAKVDAYYALENLVARNNYLHSIYLYSDKYGYFSSLKGDEGFDNISDSSLSDFLATHPYNSTLYQRNINYQDRWDSSYISSSQDPEILNLFTICNNYYDEDGNIQYGIIVNLDESKARELFFADIDSSYVNFYMFTEDGNFISHPNPKDYGKKVKDYPLFEKLNEQESKNGTMRIKDENGVEYLACWLEQDEMNWKLVYLLPMHEIIAPINALRNTLVFIFLIILLLAFLAIFITSRRMDKYLSRRTRIVSYIRGNIDNSSFIYSPQTYFSLAIIKLHYPKQDRLELEDINTGRIEYDYISKYLKNRKILGYLLNMEKNTYLYLIPKEVSNLSSHLLKLQIDLNDDLNISMDSIYCDGLTTFEELPDEANLLLDSIKNKSLETKSFVSPLEKSENSEPFDKSNLVLFDTNSLEKALITKDAVAYEKEVNNLIKALQEQKNWELFNSLKIYLYYVLEGTGVKYFKINTSAFFEEWKKIILHSCNYESLRKSLLKIIELINQSNNDESNRHQKELIILMKDVVEKNLTDVNLSATYIADALHLSLGYVRAQFKSFEGESINDYIGRLRLEKACTLLIETNQCINEIRIDVGFSNYSYFCTYFKKCKGMSPSSYRKQFYSIS
jgi:AraC-like DNA-binding protein